MSLVFMINRRVVRRKWLCKRYGNNNSTMFCVVDSIIALGLRTPLIDLSISHRMHFILKIGHPLKLLVISIRIDHFATN